MKNKLFILIWYISMIYWFSLKSSANYKDNILPAQGVESEVVSNLWKDWVGAEDQIDDMIKWLMGSIDTLLPITAIGVFLFVGIRLWVARWNPEEFKKAWMQFIYAVVGIFVVSFAWASVKLVQGINIF